MNLHQFNGKCIDIRIRIIDERHIEAFTFFKGKQKDKPYQHGHAQLYSETVTLYSFGDAQDNLQSGLARLLHQVAHLFPQYIEQNLTEKKIYIHNISNERIGIPFDDFEINFNPAGFK